MKKSNLLDEIDLKLLETVDSNLKAAGVRGGVKDLIQALAFGGEKLDRVVRALNETSFEERYQHTVNVFGSTGNDHH